MNPRYRRLLIPGLLTVLIIVVLLTSLARSAKGATVLSEGLSEGLSAGLSAGAGGDVVSTMSDPRIGESSGLTLSVANKDLAYTINDSGNAPNIYAVQVSTGRTVGVTQVLGGPLLDTEALSIDRTGTLWIADTGDNNTKRGDVALYSLPEPGAGDHAVTATRFPVSYADGPHNVEALLINPVTGDKYLATKAVPGGKLLELPKSLSTTSPNVPTPLQTIVPAIVTDGAFTPDGRFAVLRTYGTMSVYDAFDWKLMRGVELPDQKQGETLVVEPGGDSVLIGSEGKDSQLLRVPLDTSDATPAEATAAAKLAMDDNNNRPWVAIVVAGVVLAAVGVLVARRRR